LEWFSLTCALPFILSASLLSSGFEAACLAF